MFALQWGWVCATSWEPQCWRALAAGCSLSSFCNLGLGEILEMPTLNISQMQHIRNCTNRIQSAKTLVSNKANQTRS